MCKIAEYRPTNKRSEFCQCRDGNQGRRSLCPNSASVETETRVEEAFVFVQDTTSEATALSIKHLFSLIFGIMLQKYKG